MRRSSAGGDRARPPRPPRRAPSFARPPVILTSREQLIRSLLAIVAALMFAFLLNVTVLGNVQHLAAQQQLGDSLRRQLADGTAPVSEGDVDDVLLRDGAPVAVLDIPSIGVHEVVVEGTASGVLRSGPGHRRDTVLPGQAGVSVVLGRAAAFGGPFADLQKLAPGREFTVITGQGKHRFEVIGLRYAGDPAPPRPQAGESRLILVTARGLPYSPSGVAWVDARLVGPAQPPGARQTTFATLPLSDGALATDPSTAWALVFALQFLLVVEIAAVWSFRRIGSRQTWVVFVPVAMLSGLLVTDQVIRLLPNLL